MSEFVVDKLLMKLLIRTDPVLVGHARGLSVAFVHYIPYLKKNSQEHSR